MSRIKVLQVVRPAVGGMKEHVQSLLKHLDRALFAPALACPRHSALEQVALAMGIEVFPVEISAAISPYEDVRAIYQLAGVLKSWCPDIVHPHGSKAALVSRLACSLQRRSTAVVVTAHNFVHVSSVKGWKQKALLSMEKYLDKKTALYITVSQSLKDDLIQRLNIQPDKVVTIYNGLELERFNSKALGHKQTAEIHLVRTQLGLSAENPVVGTIARFAPQKGLTYFIEMAAILGQTLPQVQFLIIGDGPLRSVLENQAQKLGVQDRIVFAGYREDIPDLLRAMDVFVLPALSEGLGISVLEAQACQVPVVAAAVGGIPEIITHGQNGILVQPRDSWGLALAVQQLLTDPKYAGDLAGCGCEFIKEKFSLQKMLLETEHRYLDVYAKQSSVK